MTTSVKNVLGTRACKIFCNKICATQYLSLFLCLFVSNGASARNYEVPPSSRTSANVPYISDAAMERCVKIYNDAKWLHAELSRSNVDQYSPSSVSAYNAQVARHSKMTDYFNTNCAGKQSESAYRAAQKLNQQQGR